jgi:CheY-like chemotaxis protein
MLGHELRNPLTPIVSSLYLMQLRGPGVLESERGVIERQTRHLVRLVDDLLDVSRSAHGRLHLERAPIELAVVTADAIEATGPLLEERNQKLAVAVPAAGLVVEADRGRLAQVVTNLLANAARYTPPGGQISLSARAEGDHVTLEVEDNGAGIEAELLPHIFDPFIQGQQGLDRKQGGLGLGLTIARKLVEGHDGTLEPRSEGPGRGTTMTVRLPSAPASATAGPAVRDLNKTRPRLVACRVLIVEDNPDTVMLLEQALVAAGHEVRTAGDGPSALRLVENYQPDVALLDIGLPGMDGYELARLLKRVPRLAQMSLIAVTGYAQEDDRKRALANGFTEHLAKPLYMDRVLELIEHFVPRPT